MTHIRSIPPPSPSHSLDFPTMPDDLRESEPPLEVDATFETSSEGVSELLESVLSPEYMAKAGLTVSRVDSQLPTSPSPNSVTLNESLHHPKRKLKRRPHFHSVAARKNGILHPRPRTHDGPVAHRARNSLHNGYDTDVETIRENSSLPMARPRPPTPGQETRNRHRGFTIQGEELSHSDGEEVVKKLLRRPSASLAGQATSLLGLGSDGAAPTPNSGRGRRLLSLGSIRRSTSSPLALAVLRKEFAADDSPCPPPLPQRQFTRAGRSGSVSSVASNDSVSTVSSPVSATDTGLKSFFKRSRGSRASLATSTATSIYTDSDTETPSQMGAKFKAKLIPHFSMLKRRDGPSSQPPLDPTLPTILASSSKRRASDVKPLRKGSFNIPGANIAWKYKLFPVWSNLVEIDLVDGDESFVCRGPGSDDDEEEADSRESWFAAQLGEADISDPVCDS